jgi:hypothetical protein
MADRREELRAIAAQCLALSGSTIDSQARTALLTMPAIYAQLVEEGFEAVLSRKPRAMPAVARIF